MLLTNQITHGSGQIKQGYFPKFYGNDGQISLEIAFVPSTKQWIKTVGRLANEPGIGFCYKMATREIITTKEAGRLLKLHGTFTHKVNKAECLNCWLSVHHSHAIK